ncbi:integrase core domain protein [Mariprofundus micogutta]|uniref:Integrase core domain protein n=1 Tax=Mariprofundus micogutta TaxID=1921010 RepID=A0A1L8CRE9_9PROT|nr:IS21 family transposase [Mariprofundus micogutta]GAV21477.1 integrase core domain protein [Mariprofundus micogutta]
METKAKVRRDFYVHKKSIKQIVRERQLSRNTVRKILRDDDTSSEYQRTIQPCPVLGNHEPQLVEWLTHDAALPRKQRRNAVRLHQQLSEQGYQGAYDSVQRFVKQWREQARLTRSQAFIPLEFSPGDAMQFDWSMEHVVIGGVAQTIKVGHFRLSYSRKLFLVAFPREQLEMVLEAHNCAFAYFGGSSKRIIYDNPKTIVHRILNGKERDLNKRFARMASHYLFEPVMCNPSAGWEKGQVEKQVQDVRNWIFLPKLKFDSMDKLNAHLQTECDRLARRNHPTMKEKTIAEVFEEERALLIHVRQPFEAYTEHECKASNTSLVRYDRHHYSVDSMAAGCCVTLRAYADRIHIVYKDQLVAEHVRSFKRDGISYDPWHYIEALKRKPGALRDGAPFKQWSDLPPAMARMRRKLATITGGDRQFVLLLCAVSEHGLDPVARACQQALDAGVIQADWILNLLARAEAQEAPEPIDVPQVLMLDEEPVADCDRYNVLLSLQEVSHAIH